LINDGLYANYDTSRVHFVPITSGNRGFVIPSDSLFT
jgi:hypothetical protein